MWEKIADPGAAIAEAALLGVLLSMVYDLLRIRRALLPLPWAAVFAEDVLYCLFSGFSFFLVLMDVGDGSVRWWLLLSLTAGWLAEHFTLGLLAVTLARLILLGLRFALWQLLRLLLLPPIRAARLKNNRKSPNKTLAKRPKERYNRIKRFKSAPRPGSGRKRM